MPGCLAIAGMDERGRSCGNLKDSKTQGGHEKTIESYPYNDRDQFQTVSSSRPKTLKVGGSGRGRGGGKARDHGDRDHTPEPHSKKHLLIGKAYAMT